MRERKGERERESESERIIHFGVGCTVISDKNGYAMLIRLLVHFLYIRIFD